MKRISALIALLAIVFAIGSGKLDAQVLADVGVVGNYTPSNFSKYSTVPVTGTPANGVFNLQITKSGGTIPANNYTIIVSLAPGVSYTGEPVTVPQGFTMTVVSPEALTFKQTGDHTGSGLAARKTIDIPVQANQAIAAGSANNWLVTVQQDDLGYIDVNPLNDNTQGRVTVAESSLPVNLASFTVAKEGSATSLNWVTTQEVNSDFFEIQHSRDAKHWLALGQVQSHKDSKMNNEYGYTHAAPVAGLNYYRLKMVDRDGSFDYSDIKSTTFEGGAGIETAVKIYPNPVSTGLLTIETAGNAPVKRIEVLNSAGIRVHVAPAGKLAAHTVEVGRCPAGIYLARVVFEDGSSSSHRVVVTN